MEPTSTLMRHKKSVWLVKVKQKILTLVSVMFDGKGGGPPIYKYDKENVKEIIMKMITIDEYSFRMVGHKVFNVILKIFNPKFDSVPRV